LLKDGLYTFANNTAAQYLGFGSGAEIIGQDFFADIIAHDHGYVKERINAAVRGKTEEVFEIPMMQPGGEVLYLQAVALPLTVNGENSILIIGTDITDRKHAEVRALASLREKETLLKEIHHRVKNNLQIISSLLNLQSEYIVGDDAKHAFVESLSRIRSMALIHERLYQTKDFSRIEISEYINDLVHFLVRTFNTRNVAINLAIDVEKIFLNLDTAMPIGLIINELVSNAFKYAYIGRTKGNLQISCKVTGMDRLLLDVADDGVGFPDAINFKDTMSLGFQLVCSLVEQLHGDISLDKSNGTRFTINCAVL
ncbi:MAG: PAS domain-containing protein, partial [Ignavibacteriales bacterium]|nr:PAS domain-containing protein [Ignavibacteriales bacterium]